MIVYATPSDIVDDSHDHMAWFTSGELPGNIDALLRDASVLVARACNRNLSDAPAVGDAIPLRDATCAQVTSWLALGIDPAKAGTDIEGPVKSSTILSAKVDRDTTVAVAAQQDARDGLCPLANDILSVAGLLWVPVPQFDSSGVLPTFGLDAPRSATLDGYGWPPMAEWPAWPFY